jgi:hypothetical protein
MKLSAPKKGTWFVALIAGALGVVAHYRVIHVAALAPFAILLLVAAWALLLVATFVKGL